MAEVQTGFQMPANLPSAKTSRSSRGPQKPPERPKGKGGKKEPPVKKTSSQSWSFKWVILGLLGWGLLALGLGLRELTRLEGSLFGLPPMLTFIGSWGSIAGGIMLVGASVRINMPRWHGWFSGFIRWGGRALLLGSTLLIPFHKQALQAGLGEHFVGQTLPEIKSGVQVEKPGTIQVYAQGEKIAEQARFFTASTEKLPDMLIQALTSSEDATFFQHEGMSPQGMTRAFLQALRRGRLGAGGSTISMQVAKGLFPEIQKIGKLRYKIAQIMLAWRLEEMYSKEQILQMYFDLMYCSAGRYGVVECSKYYFNRTPGELTLTQVAQLVGMVQSPNNQNPVTAPKTAKKRRAYVLGRMLADGKITPEQHTAALEADLELDVQESPDVGPNGWVVQRAYNDVERLVGPDRWRKGGIQIHLTVDPELQKTVQAAILDQLQEIDKRQGFPKSYNEESLSRKEPYSGEPRRFARLTKVDEQYVYWDIGLGYTARTPLSTMKRYFSMPAEKAQKYKKELQKWGKAHAKWEQKGKKGDEPEKPSEPERELRLTVGNTYRISVVEVNKEEKTATVYPYNVQAAHVVVDPQTFDILAYVCGDDYRLNRNDRCATGYQVGSTAKPLGVYLAALSDRLFTPWGTADQHSPQLLVDEKRNYTFAVLRADGKTYEIRSDWPPKNYGEKYSGPETLRKCLSQSKNSCAATLIAPHKGAGPSVQDPKRWEEVRIQLEKFGLDTKSFDSPSNVALGGGNASPLKLAEAYAIVANGGLAPIDSQGKMAEPRLIQKVIGPDGQPIETSLDDVPKRERVFSQAVLWLLRHMMRSVIDDGSGVRLKNFPHPVAGKTGTTNDSQRTWFVGILSKAVTVSALGYDIPEGIKGQRMAETGASSALPITIEVLEYLRQSGKLDGVRDEDDVPEGYKTPLNGPTRGLEPPPPGVVCLPFDHTTGLRKMLAPGEPETKDNTECFLEGTEPLEYAQDPLAYPMPPDPSGALFGTDPPAPNLTPLTPLVPPTTGDEEDNPEPETLAP